MELYFKKSRQYPITGFCGIDPCTMAFFYKIPEETNDSTDFASAVEETIMCGFLLQGNVLVMDNATIHIHQEHEYLEDFLWECKGPFDGMPMYIGVLRLPTRSPELNPIELSWN
eukprot:15353853-Ditylum_brightwellii.AAC.2